MLSDQNRDALTIIVKEMTRDLRDNLRALDRENRLRLRILGDATQQSMYYNFIEQRQFFWRKWLVAQDQLCIAHALLVKFDVHFGILGSVYRDVHVHVQFDEGELHTLSDKDGNPSVVRFTFQPWLICCHSTLALRPEHERVYHIDIDVLDEHALMYQPLLSIDRRIQSVHFSVPKDQDQEGYLIKNCDPSILWTEETHDISAIPWCDFVDTASEKMKQESVGAAVGVAATGEEEDDDEDDDAHPAYPPAPKATAPSASAKQTKHKGSII